MPPPPDSAGRLSAACLLLAAAATLARALSGPPPELAVPGSVPVAFAVSGLPASAVPRLAVPGLESAAWVTEPGGTRVVRARVAPPPPPSVDEPSDTRSETPTGRAERVLALTRDAGDFVRACRREGVPARPVGGLVPVAGGWAWRVWAEVRLNGQWVAADPETGRLGYLPEHWHAVAPAAHWLADPLPAGATARAWVEEASPPARVSMAERLSLAGLPEGERRPARVLIGLAVAAALVAALRNLVGLNPFGTFAPALLGVALAESESWAALGWAVAALPLGWAARRFLEPLGLLQVPRAALMLTLAVAALLVAGSAAGAAGGTLLSGASLFPLVVLVGVVERHWALEEEEGRAAALRTLLVTLAVAAALGALLGSPPARRELLARPELLLASAGCLLALGRYTGFRLTELWRFRRLTGEPPFPPLTPGMPPLAFDRAPAQAELARGGRS